MLPACLSWALRLLDAGPRMLVTPDLTSSAGEDYGPLTGFFADVGYEDGGGGWSGGWMDFLAFEVEDYPLDAHGEADAGCRVPADLLDQAVVAAAAAEGVLGALGLVCTSKTVRV